MKKVKTKALVQKTNQEEINNVDIIDEEKEAKKQEEAYKKKINDMIL